MISTIIQVILALPKILDFVRSVVLAVRLHQAAMEEKKRQDAIQKMREAKTPEEIEKANEEITRRLP